jgi:peptidoglycan biosynthesis protein MviN/MurJ (putative lipid II flippase)
MSILRGSFIVILGTLGIKVTLLVKDILVSQQFGLSFELALYLSAFLIPSILSNHLGICLQVFATPKLVANNNRISKDLLKQSFLQQLFFTFCLYSLLILGINVIFPQDTVDHLIQLRVLLLFTLPYFLLMPLRTLFGQVLYLNNFHSSNFILGFISPISMITYLSLKKNLDSFDLGLIIAVSSVVEFFCVYFYLKANKLIGADFSSYKIHNAKIVSIFFLQVFISSNLLIDQLFANRAGAEFLAIFNYASKVPGIIGSISMILSSSIFLPAFQSLKDNNLKLKFDKKKLVGSFLLVTLLTIGAYEFSYLITQIIYQRGNFTEEASIQVSQIQSYYFLMAPCTAFFLAFIRYLNAMDQNRLALYYGLFSFVSLWLVDAFLLKMGLHHFIPFSVTIGYCIIFLFHFYQKRIHDNYPARS